MPTLTRHPRPTLRLRERERGAFACVDAVGYLHWVRVFDGTIMARPGQNATNAGRLEAPDGSPVCHVEGRLYVLWSRTAFEWIEVEAIVQSSVKAPPVSAY